MALPEGNKRKVQGINREGRDKLSLARKTLYGVLGERDPVKLYRAVAVALAELDEADKRMEEIEIITKLAQKREPYKQQEETP